MDVAAWLRYLGLERYKQAFKDNAIDFALLRDLRDIGIKAVGDRRRLLEAIAAFQEAGGCGLEPDRPAASPSRPRDAERRQLTVMFVDLVGSTLLAARLDPEDMREVLGAYQVCCAEVVGRFEGYVAKFMADGVLAYFGWPAAHEDDAERAVLAGLERLPRHHSP
jgi:class 3 adenylate cyclase